MAHGSRVWLAWVRRRGRDAQRSWEVALRLDWEEQRQLEKEEEDGKEKKERKRKREKGKREKKRKMFSAQEVLWEKSKLRNFDFKIDDKILIKTTEMDLKLK